MTFEVKPGTFARPRFGKLKNHIRIASLKTLQAIHQGLKSWAGDHKVLSTDFYTFAHQIPVEHVGRKSDQILCWEKVIHPAQL
jgi:hypothetical protein